jgi:hypothetical protein
MWLMLGVLLHALCMVWHPRMLPACCYGMCWDNSLQSTGSYPHVGLAAAGVVFLLLVFAFFASCSAR